MPGRDRVGEVTPRRASRDAEMTERQITRWLVSRGMPVGDAASLPGSLPLNMCLGNVLYLSYAAGWAHQACTRQAALLQLVLSCPLLAPPLPSQ